MDLWIVDGMSAPLSNNPKSHPSGFPSFLRAESNATSLAVKLQPRASKNEIVPHGGIGDELKIKVTAPPVDFAANEALIEFLAEKLNCGRKQIEIIRGHKSRHKTLKLPGLTVEEILKQL